MKRAWDVEEYQNLESAVLAGIAGAAWTDEQFNALILRSYHFQRRHNAPYDAYCRSLGVPMELGSWREIPAVPQTAFKDCELRSFPAALTQKTFQTSGTTGQVRGRHHFCSLRLYDAAIVGGWSRLNLPDLPRLLLTRTPTDAPESSLAHMTGVLAAQEGALESRFCIRADGSLDYPAAREFVESNVAAQTPIALLGTALAFLHLFEEMERHRLRVSLPDGSFAMETGGYKGSARDLQKHELYAQFTNSLGLPPSMIINEYGMTELSSQFYTRGLDLPHRGAPWAAAMVIDPEFDAPAALGRTGLLRIFDLANLGSVVAVQTEDLAICLEDGFQLLGRAPLASYRGCSRSADELLLAKRN